MKDILHFFHSASQMLRNCKVARVLPRIVDCAKNDRNAILRARYIYLPPFEMSVLLDFVFL